MRMTPVRQRGMTTIGVVLLLAMIAFFVLIGLKLYPIYYDSFKVGAALDSLKADPTLAGKSSVEVVDRLMKRLSIDNVDHVEKSDVTVEKSGKGIRVSVEYEARKNIVGNVDVMVSFSKAVEVGN
ncbi:MAG: DUF4845 domain-containing protein [Gammaproteobacteria bacterium]|nr:DUF4845 domain-containing protein [Gammaproteobacteria bacterium]